MDWKTTLEENAAIEEVVRGAGAADFEREVIALCEQGFAVEVQEYVQLDDFEDDDDLDFNMGLIVADMERELVPRSYKVSNIVREKSRSLQVAILLGLSASFIPISPIVGIMAFLTTLGVTAKAAITTNVGYNEAVVLRKAWVIAGESRVTTVQALRAVREEMSSEYLAPKLAHDRDIDDALRNLAGIRAVMLAGDEVRLREKITFLENGLPKEG